MIELKDKTKLQEKKLKVFVSSVGTIIKSVKFVFLNKAKKSQTIDAIPIKKYKIIKKNVYKLRLHFIPFDGSFN